MKLLSALICVYVVSLGAAHSGDAATLLTFDDLTSVSPDNDWALISNGYGSLQWYNFGVFNGSVRPVTEGYRTGTVSPTNVAFNIFGDPASISSRGTFTLKSAYLTAAFVDGMQIHVQGFVRDALTYDNTYTVNTTGPTLINFNYMGVNQVWFIASPSTQFVMDNLVVSGMDSDGDGVPDDQDQCPDTLSGAVVNEHGCSIDQLVPCAGPATGGTWRNHRQYVAALIAAADAFLAGGLITADERDAVVRAARRSDCGKK